MIGRVKLQVVLSKRIFSGLTPFLLLCILGAVFAAHAADAPAAKPGGEAKSKAVAKRPARATPVKVAAAKRMHLAPQTWVAGTVISREEARLATEVAGKLLQVADVGTKVQAGDVIARVDATFIHLKIEEYTASVQSEQATLGYLESEMKRLNRLAKQNNTAQTRLEEVRANREVARSKLQIAKTRLKQAQEESRRHQIVAPFAGVVVERYTRPGESAKVGDEVVRLIDTRSLEVQARIPLNTRDFVAEGDELTLTGNGHTQKVKVRALVAAGDERSRLLELRVAISGEGWTIGQPVRISLPTATAKEVLAIPRDALVLRRDGAIVFRINAENKAEGIPVQLGVASGPFMEVIGSLQAGDKVVIRGGERLRPGAVVMILPDGPPGGNGKAGGKPESKAVVKRDGAGAKPANDTTANKQP